MKKNWRIVPILLCVLALFQSSFLLPKQNFKVLQGSWKYVSGSTEEILLFTDGYCSHTAFSRETKKFLFTRGGTYEHKKNRLEVAIEFNSTLPDEVGNKKTYNCSLTAKELVSDINGNVITWSRIDDGSGLLNGNWQITGRKNGEEIVPMNPGPRKTVKLLTGARFQWIAINTLTKEFFGTGGGNYRFESGKYTELIEFFSRDSSRVGATLTFDGKVEGTKWTHQGSSSRGEPIHEIWERKNPVD